MHVAYETYRCLRQVSLGAALMAGIAISSPNPTMATEPEDPIQIITPEDLAIRGKFVSDTLEIQILEGAVSDLRAKLMLYQNGELLAEEPLKLDFAKVEQDIDEDDKNAKRPALLIAKRPATPERIWREMKPGVYAHLIRIEGKLTDGDGPILVEEWVRWRTDGRRIEYLDIEHYSELVDKAEITTDAEGNQIAVFVGIDRKLEKEEEPQKIDFDTRIDNGVVLEQPEVLHKFELENQLDEREED